MMGKKGKKKRRKGGLKRQRDFQFKEKEGGTHYGVRKKCYLHR